MVDTVKMTAQQLYYIQYTQGISSNANIGNIYGGDTSYKPPLKHEYPIGLPPQIELSEAYKYFLQALKEGRHFNNFYKQLITLRRDILLDIANRNQGTVAKDLNINTVKMSAIVAMLKEIDAPQLHVTNPNA